MFPSHQSFRCIKTAPRKTTDRSMMRGSLRGHQERSTRAFDRKTKSPAEPGFDESLFQLA
jgi:hypothetical protein